MSEELAENTELPARFVERLREAGDVSGIDTQEVDRMIDGLAASHFRRRPGRAGARYAGYAALAASLALISLLLPMGILDQGFDQDAGDFARQLSSKAVPILYGDVDGSGRIDIADVLELARENEGLVSESDLEAFALRVVSLSAEAGIAR